MAPRKPGRYRDRDPVSGAKMLDGITAVVSERTRNVTYQARWSWVGANGKRHQETVTCKSLDEAEDTLLDRKVRIRRGTYAPDETITMAEYFEQWFSRKKSSSWRSSSAYRVRRDWEKHLKPSVGDIPVAKMTRAICQREVDRLVGLKKAKSTDTPRFAPSTVRLIMTVLSGVLDGALRDDLIDRNPAAKLELPRTRKRTKVVWSSDQARTFLDTAHDDPYRLVWWFLFTTGCRIGEIIALRWSAVDLVNQRVTFRATRRRREDGSIEIGEGTKTSDEDQTIPLVPVMVDLLREHQKSQRAQRIVAIDGFVFLSPSGDPLNPSTVAETLDRRITAAGFPRITPHGMRHTAATLLVALRVPESVVKEILRHQSITTTVDTYLHPDEDLLREAISRLGDALDTTTSPANVDDVVGNV